MSSDSSTTDRRRLLEPALLAATAGVVLFDSATYPGGLEGAPGPALFPRILAFVLLGGAGVLTWRALRGTGIRKRPRPVASASAPRRPWVFWAAAGWLAGALAAMPHLGAPGALALLVGGLLWLGGERAPGILIALPIGFAGAVWLLFAGALGVPLP